MMKRKGFTLTELMGVLIILGLLSLIIIPLVSNILKEQKEKQYEQQITNIKLMAKNFGVDNLSILPTKDNESMDITIGQLKSLGYVEKNIVNPITEQEISDCARVTITKSGKNYNYTYNKDSENDNTCNVMGNVMISLSGNEYINKNGVTSYVITINETNQNNIINKYEIDRTKINLTGETNSTFNVIEGNGIYRIVINGGEKEGIVGLKLDSKAILKNGIDDMIGNGGIQALETVTVDNTTPTISFGTNGSSNWLKSASSIITVEDSLSGGDETTYKYIYTTNSNVNPSINFTSGFSYSETIGSGRYYLIATACDKAGNCIKEITNAFRLDNTSPEISNVVVNSCNNDTRTITVSGTDTDSGISGYLITNSTTTPSASSFISSGVSSWTSQAYPPGTYYAWVKDAVDNISLYTTVSVGTCYSDTVGPLITFGTNGSSSYVSSASTKLTVTDESEVASINYGWSTSSSSTSAGSLTTSGSILNSKCSRTTDGDCYLYVKACDIYGNCSEKRSNVFKLDVTAPVVTINSYSSCLNGLKMEYDMSDFGSKIVQHGYIFCDKDLGASTCYNDLIDSRLKTVSSTQSKIVTAEWTTCNPDESAHPKAHIGYSSWVIVIDAAGNIGKADTSSTTGDILPFNGVECNTCP